MQFMHGTLDEKKDSVVHKNYAVMVPAIGFESMVNSMNPDALCGSYVLLDQSAVFFFNTILTKFRYFPAPASMDLRSLMA